MVIKNLTQESYACRFLTTLETDVDHICKMKPSEWENSLNCGAFIFELRERIDGFLEKDLKSFKKEERTVVKGCLVEIRKILRLLQTCYRLKVFSSITIHSMVSDMRNYIRNVRVIIGKQNHEDRQDHARKRVANQR